MVKQVVVVLKFQVFGGQVILVLLIGFVFGQYGVNIGQFVQQFNDCIKDQVGVICLVELMVYKDKLFDFILKSLFVVVLVKKYVKLFDLSLNIVEKGFGVLNKEKVGKILCDDLCKIVEIKLVDMNVFDVEVVVEMIVGIVCLMGVIVED